MLPGVHEALARLKAAGFALVVVTNQPDVARGSLTEQALQAMHEHLAALLPLDEVRVVLPRRRGRMRLPEAEGRPADPASPLRSEPERRRRRPLA